MSTVHKLLGLPRGADCAADWLPLINAELGELVAKRVEIETRLAALREEDNALAREAHRAGRGPREVAPAPASMTRARALLGGLLSLVPPQSPPAATHNPAARAEELRAEREALEAAHAMLVEPERAARRRAADEAWARASPDYRRRASALVAAIAELSRRHADMQELAGPLGRAGAIPQSAMLPLDVLTDSLASGPASGALGAFVREAERAGLGTDSLPAFAA